ncbi:HesB/YadR/YfhF family protein [Bacillus testis]|uniref:HesB/YadR/YfhF family protein n=1 Tax=Bacillus testis TaxID=1622072 RepID=UPI00067F50CB|nr:HesB/YadR/YfhF family protein [Bacillus testis]
MNIYITDQAATWYQDELGLKNGDSVRFFARYGGESTIQAGFSLGIQLEKPINAAAEVKKNNILYFIDESDLWYFDNKDLYVDYNAKKDEPVFTVK